MQELRTLNPGHQPVDIHVHVLGNGKSGSGCRFSVRWWQHPFVRMMARHIGLRVSGRDPALDRLFVQRLRDWVRGSSVARVIILACDDVYDEHGTRHPGRSGLFVPNDYVLGLARRFTEFLPGISIHPGRCDAIDELERCAEAGAKLLKLLPCVQIVECSNPRYKPFWERLARLRLPLLAHTGGEFSLPTHRYDLRSVETLRLPLECGVSVIAAHCGAPALPWDKDYFDQFDRMRKNYPNLFGDVSALSQPTHLRVIERLRDDARQVLYGSDYPVVTAVFWSLMKGWISRSEFAALQAIRNPLEKKIRLTRALGFPDRIFTDFWSLYQ